MHPPRIKRGNMEPGTYRVKKRKAFIPYNCIYSDTITYDLYLFTTEAVLEN